MNDYELSKIDPQMFKGHVAGVTWHMAKCMTQVLQGSIDGKQADCHGFVLRIDEKCPLF